MKYMKQPKAGSSVAPAAQARQSGAEGRAFSPQCRGRAPTGRGAFSGQSPHPEDNTAQQESIVITTYEPDPSEWEPGFEKRRQR